MARPSPVAAAALVASGVAFGALVSACGGTSGSGPASGPIGASSGCQPAGSTGASGYPGAGPQDCVGYSRYHFIVRVDGYEALMGNWKRYTDDQGHHLICAGVNVENLASEPQRVAPTQFRLRTPAGVVESGQAAPSNGLSAKRLSTGVQQGGGVCWADPGAGGVYVGSFEPTTGAARGVWTITFLPA